jgi:hypothetical protein
VIVMGLASVTRRCRTGTVDRGLLLLCFHQLTLEPSALKKFGRFPRFRHSPGISMELLSLA